MSRERIKSCLSSSFIYGVSNLTKQKMLDRYFALKGKGEPFETSFYQFEEFEQGLAWDYDIRRTLDGKFLSFWPLFNTKFEYDDSRRYFEQIITPLNLDSRLALEAITSSGMFSYDFSEINGIVSENLLNHELEIDQNPTLAEAIVSHTGGTLNLNSEFGRTLSQSRSPPLSRDMIVWRSMDQKFLIDGQVAGIGDRGQVRNSVWSTSYDPISAYAFAMADETEDHPNIHMLKIKIPKGFTQGWFVENTCFNDEYVMKQQFEYSIFGGNFMMVNYYEKYIDIPDSSGALKNVLTRFYELEFFLN